MKGTKDTRKECDRRKEMWQMYFQGTTPAHFPLPAIPIVVEFHSWAEPSPFHSSITWAERSKFCDNCGGLAKGLVAIVDFNWDRCMDFNYGVGVYVAGQELEDGLSLYMGAGDATR